MSWIKAALAAVVISSLAGCALKPTRVSENPERKVDLAGDRFPTKITAETIVVDARTPFDFSMAHVPRSVNIWWADYTDPEPAQHGILQADLYALARRLARYGISPASQVVVIGKGFDGQGEEGRVAWMLAYLGVTNVHFASLDALKFRMTNVMDENPPKNAQMWKPEPIENLNVTRAEVKFAINKKAMFEPQAFKPGQEPLLYRLIDVRSEAGYLGREGIGAQKAVPNMEAVNIPWKQFFTPGMRPRSDMSMRLREVGVLPEHRVIVLGEDGIASAAVTMALRSLGYANAGCYSGGLVDLMSVATQ